MKNENGVAFDVPILFIVFNRLETTKLVFQEIRKIRPNKLFIAADGSRPDKIGEREKCDEVRNFILENIDWDCEVQTLLRDNNIGCGRAVSSAIDWFFETVEMGIILEDDCIPDQSFFQYCEMLLRKYRYDTRITHINGTSFVSDSRCGESYYFSKYFHVWGWATWRRSWKNYDFSMKSYPKFLEMHQIDNLFSDSNVRKHWISCFDGVYSRKIDTWDYQWVYANFINNGLCIYPFTNMISNIGFGEDATHTKNENDKSSSRKTEQLGEITHPTFFVHDSGLDFFIYAHHVGLTLSSDAEKQQNIRLMPDNYKNKKSRWKMIFSVELVLKSLHLVLHGRHRQLIRKILYVVRFKKLK